MTYHVRRRRTTSYVWTICLQSICVFVCTAVYDPFRYLIPPNDASEYLVLFFLLVRSSFVRSFVRSFVQKTWQILILPRLGPGSARRYGPTAVAPALAKLKFEIWIFYFTSFWVFRQFRSILEELDDFWCQNLIPWWFLLQVHNFWGLYEAWRSVSDICSFDLGRRRIAEGAFRGGSGGGNQILEKTWFWQLSACK